MHRKLLCLAAVLSGAALCAQEQSPEVLAPHNYVRRFSAGATLTVLGLPSVGAGDKSVVTTTPPVDALYVTENASQRIGYGLTAQLAITEHFAVAASLFMRRVGYMMDSDVYEGVDNPATAKDDRTHTISHEDTRARFIDIPVVVRYYNRPRTRPGPRVFLEGGIASRQISHVRTAISSSVNSGATVCCDFTPAVPAQTSMNGLVVGLGVQLIDPVGVRVVPEVRYTRWRGKTFNALSTVSKQNQIEAMISLTF